jgi:hypothetical protein
VCGVAVSVVFEGDILDKFGGDAAQHIHNTPQYRCF